MTVISVTIIRLPDTAATLAIISRFFLLGVSSKALILDFPGSRLGFESLLLTLWFLGFCLLLLTWVVS